MTIRLLSITTSYKFLVDKAPKGEAGIGDVIWAKSTLKNSVAQFGKPRGAVVGSDVATLTVTSPTSGDMKVQAKLPGGTLRSAGRIGESRAPVIRVTGGTGAFAGARGTVEVISLNAAGDRTINVYRLRLP